MCGIAGYALKDGLADPATVRSMCDRIRHRGPDDDGVYCDGGCAIGMRRLSIIDLETGHQPIFNEDGGIAIVFNGEIYNYRELRQDLIARGHRFSTNSDTETLVHLYEEEGVAGLAKLRGMFAFAIRDRNRKTLFLARDRYGKKPLYYAAVPAGIYFASELKCLSAAGLSFDIDDDALRLYFHLGYIPGPWTVWRQARKLPPASWMIHHDDGRIESGKYWELPVPAAHAPEDWNEAAAKDRLRDLFDESVRIRMIADVPLGAFLSGGIDSSSVVASMALQSAEPVRTFSIGFEEAGFNELPWAAEVARLYKTEHHEIVVRPDSVNLVGRLVRCFDEPFGDSSAIPTYIVSEFAAKHVKVALSGDGGDELFGGYTRFATIGKMEGFDAVPQVLRRAVARGAGALPYSARGRNYLRMISRPTALDRYFEANYAPHFLLDRLLDPEWAHRSEAGGFLRSKMSHCLPPGGADPLTQAMYFETAANLPGDMLVKVDRMSMANSLEVRCPLLDHKLGEFAATLPNSCKIRNGKLKQILIEALADRLPPSLLDRPKMGFGVPLAKWFRGPLREMTWDLLTSPQCSVRRIVSPSFVRKLLEEHQSGRRDNHAWIWSLLMLELWFRETFPAPVRRVA
jgi:asparagine synthase (glutamine-hydrolysing)